MKKICIMFLGCLVLLAWSSFSKASLEKTEDCQVLKVIDGDTIDVLYQGGKERIRLLRIDTPERDEEEYFQAKEALKKLVGGRKIRLEFEIPGQIERGVYGRILAYVWVDNMSVPHNVNIEMVRLGYSRFYTKYGEGKYAEEFRNAERKTDKHYPKDILGTLDAPVNNFYVYAYDDNVRNFNISQHGIINSPPADKPDNSNSKAADKNSTVSDAPSALTFTGQGVDITKTFYCGGGLVIFKAAHTGDGHFFVQLRKEETGQMEELLVNKIGIFTGTIPENPPEGNYLLEIGADGNWTIIVTGDVSLW